MWCHRGQRIGGDPAPAIGTRARKQQARPRKCRRNAAHGGAPQCAAPMHRAVQMRGHTVVPCMPCDVHVCACAWLSRCSGALGGLRRQPKRRRAQAPAGAKYMQYQGPPGPPRRPRAKKRHLGPNFRFPCDFAPSSFTKPRLRDANYGPPNQKKCGTKIDRPTFCVIFFVCTVLT